MFHSLYRSMLSPRGDGYSRANIYRQRGGDHAAL